MLERASRWVDQHVPYSQSAYHSDGEGRSYRTDCSGFVSMAWHANDSYWTGSLPQISRTISYDALQPGDALLKSTHTALFVRWADSSHTSMVIMEETSGGARQTVYSSARYHQFTPIRYTNISG